MATSYRYTSADLDLFPDDGKRREIIAGELYVSKMPHTLHQHVYGTLYWAMRNWDVSMAHGQTHLTPGVVFADDDDVVPDLVWCSRERLATALDEAGHFRIAPDLVVEVLSPGAANVRRDRVAKLDLYSRRAVLEYWIVDWQGRQVEVFRRADLRLQPVATLREEDALASPLLPGFAFPLVQLFADLPRVQGD